MKKILSTVFTVAAMVCAVVALIMLTQPALKIKGTDISYSLLEVTFGCDVDGERYLKMSFLNLLPFILLCASLAGLIVHLVSIFVKPKEGGRKISSTFSVILIFIVFIVAGVLFFYVISFIEPAVPKNLTGEQQEAYVKGIKETFKKSSELGTGAITAAVFCFLGAAMTLATKIVQAVVKD